MTKTDYYYAVAVEQSRVTTASSLTNGLKGPIEFILGFLIVFFFVMLILRFFGERIEDLLKAVKINFINQLAGGALLGLVAAFIIGGLLTLLSNLKILTEEYMTQSTLYDHLITVSRDGGWVVDAA